jgi:hypothetical protein
VLAIWCPVWGGGAAGRDAHAAAIGEIHEREFGEADLVASSVGEAGAIGRDLVVVGDGAGGPDGRTGDTGAIPPSEAGFCARSTRAAVEEDAVVGIGEIGLGVVVGCADIRGDFNGFSG